MSDVAVLGLAVDSAPVEKATASLRNFSAAAADSETRVRAIQAAADRTGVSYKEMEARVKATTSGQNQYVEQTMRVWEANQQAAKTASQAAEAVGAVAGKVTEARDAQEKYNKAANDNTKAGNEFQRMHRQMAQALGIFGLGFGTALSAAMQLYEYLQRSGTPTEKILEQQETLLRRIKNSYDSATDSARKFYEESKNVTVLQLLQQQLELQEKVTAATIKGLKTTVEIPIGGGIDNVRIKEQYQAFAEAIHTLNEGWQQGTPNVAAFRDEVAKIALTQPALQKLGQELLAATGDASQFAFKLKQVQDMLALLSGQKPTEAMRDRLGLSSPKAVEDVAAAFDKQVASINRRSAAMEAEARTAGQSESAFAKLRTELMLQEFLLSKGVKDWSAYGDQIRTAGDRAAEAAGKLAKARVDSDIDFGRKTAFLSPQDVAIAQQLSGIYGNDVPRALASSEAAALRVNNTLKSINDVIRNSAESFLTDFVSAMRKGESAMDALGHAAQNLSTTLTTGAIKSLLSGDFITAAIQGIGAIITGIIGAGQAERDAQRKLLQEIEQRKQQYRQAEQQARIAGMGSDTGLERLAQFEAQAQLERAEEARKGGQAMAELEAKQLQERMNLLNDIMKQTLDRLRSYQDRFFEATAASAETLEGALARFDRAAERERAKERANGGDIESIRRQLAEERKRIETNPRYYRGNPSDKDPESLGSLEEALRQFDIAAETRIKAAQASNEALVELERALSAERENILKEFAAKAAAAERAIVEARIAADLDVQKRLNSARGQGYINDIFDAQQAREKALAAGVDPGKVQELFRLTVQKIIDDVGMTGEAFEALKKVFPELINFTNTLANKAAIDAARSDVEEAYRREADALQSVIDKSKEFARSMKELREGLKLDANLTTLSPQERLAEAARQYRETTAAALAGDENARGRVSEVVQAYLREQRSFNASNPEYARAFDETQAMLRLLEQRGLGEVSDAQKQLDLMQQQVSGIVDLNKTMLSLDDAIRRFLGVGGVPTIPGIQVPIVAGPDPVAQQPRLGGVMIDEMLYGHQGRAKLPSPTLRYFPSAQPNSANDNAEVVTTLNDVAARLERALAAVSRTEINAYRGQQEEANELIASLRAAVKELKPKPARAGRPEAA